MMHHPVHAASDQTAPDATGRDREVGVFLDRMARALTAGDAHTVAGMWAVPAYVLGDTMAIAVNSRDEVEQFFSGAKEQYNKRGITDTHAEVSRLQWVTDRIATVDVRWPYLDEHGDERGAESSSYTLRRDDNGELKLHVALMHGEER